VCYWTGPIAVPDVVDGLLHPRHVAHRGYYEVDGAWINDAWLKLAKSGQTIRAQVHTHGGRAFHSDLDDCFPIVHNEGLLSLVIPAFAEGEVGFEGAYLTQLTNAGRWAQTDPRAALEIGK
jgi:hypothetical protein